MLSMFQNNTLSVLVTGHTGFKGTWLSVLLKELGHRVIGVSLPPASGSLYTLLQDFTVDQEYFVDIRNRNQLRDVMRVSSPDVVVHLAAQSLVLKSYRQPVETFETNVLGTANLLDSSCEITSIKSVLVATTDKVYKNDETGKRFVESDCLSGMDPYSASKVGAESVCQAWQLMSATETRPRILVARAGNVVGGGDVSEQRLIPDIVRSYKTGVPLEVRSLDATRPWQHVLDPLFGYLRYIEASHLGVVPNQLNFGPTESSKSVKEVLEMARTSLGVRYLERETANFFKESTRLELDSQQARRSLKWLPKWTQRESIDLTFEWWKSYTSGRLSALDCCLRDIREYLEK
jgi:CDP-glucose 4,6-dehydratase